MARLTDEDARREVFRLKAEGAADPIIARTVRRKVYVVRAWLDAASVADITLPLRALLVRKLLAGQVESERLMGKVEGETARQRLERLQAAQIANNLSLDAWERLQLIEAANATEDVPDIDDTMKLEGEQAGT